MCDELYSVVEDRQALLDAILQVGGRVGRQVPARLPLLRFIPCKAPTPLVSNTCLHAVHPCSARRPFHGRRCGQCWKRSWVAHCDLSSYLP